jgi:hypothetical protein
LKWLLDAGPNFECNEPVTSGARYRTRRPTSSWGIFESQAVIARKGENEFALSLVDREAREATTRRVYSEQYGKPIDQISASQVFAGILQRLGR